jgi:hypothetical protein
VEVSDEVALIQKVHVSRPSDRVLIVGHSPTVPPIIRRLGVSEGITLPDTEFDNLSVVVHSKTVPGVAPSEVLITHRDLPARSGHHQGSRPVRTELWGLV